MIRPTRRLTAAAALLLGTAASTAAAPAAHAQISVPLQRWVAVHHVTGDASLGTDVALTATVAALGEPGAAGARGQVRVIRKDDNGDWFDAETLTLADGAAGDRFGATVGLGNGLLVVAAPDKGDGVVYVFEDGPGGFTALTTLTGDADGPGFGDHLAFDGDTVAVASPRVTVASKKGRVYVFLRDAGGTPWGRAVKLAGSQATSLSTFGGAVAVSGSAVAVGDPTDPNLGNISGGGDPGAGPSGPNTGSVYVYDRYQGGQDAWGELGRAVAADGHGGQRFGASVSLSYSVLAVGAPGDHAFAVGAGAAYLYYASPGGFSAPTRIDPADPQQDGAFGRTVRLTDGRLLVSAATGDPDAPDGAPAVYVLDRPGASFGEASRIATGTAVPASWGTALAFVADEAVVGAPDSAAGVTFFRIADACTPNPCDNGGACVLEGAGGATCDCRFTSGWGERCEHPVRCSSCLDTSAPPDDPRYAEQPELAALGLDAVRSRATGAGVRVAIVGYGFDLTHPDGPAHLRVDLGYDFVDGDADPTDLAGPGTAIAGAIAAATDNALGLASLAPDAEIIPVRVIDGATGLTTAALVAAGVDHVRDAADIILISAGGLADDPALAAAVSAALAADRVVIAPAGGFPGGYVKVTAVGALDATGTAADPHGGAYAPPYDLLAPDDDLLALAAGGGYARVTGAGLAPARVAAVAADVWSASAFPSANATRDAVEKTARDLAISGYDPATGHGALRADVAVSFRLGCANCIAGTDPCSASPCKNGGACSRVNDTQFACACAAGWMGGVCTQPMGTPCDGADPCQNGATCTTAGGLISCTCAYGFYGDTCADSDCQPNPCENDGICTGPTGGTHYCICQPGFDGADCVNNIDNPCDPDPCAHGACSGTVASGPSCACEAGWDGPLCADDVDECATGNGGCAQTCSNSDGGFACACDSGFTLDGDGRGCSDIPDCPADACANGGTCVDGVNSYACACATGYKGDACELAVGCGDCGADPVHPSDPLAASDWALARIGAPWAWATSTGSPTVRVAIVSSGIDGAHPDAPAFLRPELSVDLIAHHDLQDQGGFGTYVAGLLAAPHDNDAGLAGVAPLVEVTVFKVAGPNGSTSSFLLAQGITTAVVTGAHIILVPVIAQEDFPVVRDAVAAAVAQGRLVIAPVGGYPGLYDGVLAVGAISREGHITAALATPDLVSPDGAVTSTWPSGYKTATGVGAPTALVGGVAALVWSLLPDADADAVKAVLFASAEDVGPPAWDTFSGYGLVRADSAVGAASGCGTCAAPLDPCAATPCDHGGVCDRTGADTFACACAPGFSGATCSQQHDPCVPNPCQHGGTCAFADQVVSCACPPGFGGHACQYTLGACTAPATVPGCADPDVEACVCALTPQCCSDKWAPLCAQLAGSVCAAAGAGPPPDDDPVRACVCAQLPGCCSDTWKPVCDELAHDRCEGRGDCGSTHRAPGCADPAVEACVCDLAPQCCTAKWGPVCAQLAGSQCADTATPPSANDATRACVCAQIPECCSDTWKPICDELAHDRCEGSGDCSSAHRQPGCGDPDVQACVCDQEPLCCSYTWDTACAKIAVRVCGDPAAPGPGTPSNPGACDATHSGTGCADEAVESCVCAAFPHCCAIGWDTDCVKQAVNYCAPPATHEPPPPTTDPAPPSTPPASDPPVYEGPKGTLGPCCEANADAAGCDEPVTEQCVCDLLGECCTARWDERCAAVALQVCDAFCDPDAPPPSHPPVSTVPDPITFPDVPPGDPCFGATVALTAESCLTVAFQSEIETARRNLMGRFALSELQAQAILDMRLARLAALERQKIEDEYLAIIQLIAELEDILANPQRVLSIIKDELTELKRK